MKFLLIILLAGSDGVQPVHFQKFDTQVECEAELEGITKQVPRDAHINYVGVCARIRNATEQDT